MEPAETYRPDHTTSVLDPTFPENVKPTTDHIVPHSATELLATAV